MVTFSEYFSIALLCLLSVILGQVCVAMDDDFQLLGAVLNQEHSVSEILLIFTVDQV